MKTNTATCKIDTTIFKSMIAALREIVPQDAGDFLRDETARLSEEVAKQISRRTPKNKGGLNKDIRSVFAPRPKNLLPLDAQHGTKGMRWLAAGPNYLTGVKEYRYHDTDTAQDMLKLFYKSKGHLPVDRYRDLGERKTGHWDFKARTGRNQHVSELQRVVVKRGVYKQFQAMLAARYGRLEASFALTAKILRGGSAKVKAYIARHLNGEKLPNITELSGLGNKPSPSLQFGSYAPGVEGFEDEIQTAVNIRVDKMVRRAELIMNDYAKDISANLNPRRAAKRIAGSE